MLAAAVIDIVADRPAFGIGLRAGAYFAYARDNFFGRRAGGRRSPIVGQFFQRCLKRKPLRRRFCFKRRCLLVGKLDDCRRLNSCYLFQNKTIRPLVTDSTLDKIIRSLGKSYTRCYDSSCGERRQEIRASL
jgi:hypothetical protein